METMHIMLSEECFVRDIDFSGSLVHTEGEMASAVFKLAEFVVV